MIINVKLISNQATHQLNVELAIIKFWNCYNNTTEICDWKDISKNKLLQILNDRITDVYHLPSSLYKEDRLIIYIKEKE